MKMRRALSAFLAVICILTSIGFCTLGASAEDTRSVYATTSASVVQGSTYNTCYVYVDGLTELSAITVSVHYDAERIDVQSYYNSVACTLYDAADLDGCLQFSYIFDGEGSDEDTQLFYFYYKVSDTAAVGETYFDIVVSDAYGAELDAVDIVGSRCKFTIDERTVSKTCDISATSHISTTVMQEFTVSYRISTNQIASGTITVQYDPELFEFVELTPGGFLDGKVTDVNGTLDGAVAVSFVGTSYNYNYDLVTLKFRTLKNVDESADIVLKVSELYDLDLNLVTCSGYKTTATVTIDPSYAEDDPSMLLSADYDASSNRVTLTVKLEADAHLGAGDFVLRFDPDKLTYVSSKKEFSPTFFHINEKGTSDGVLKFSIISMEDIADAMEVLTVTFDAVRSPDEQTAAFEIDGNGLTDALTNAITMNFVGCDVTIPQGILWGDANGDGTVDLLDVIMLNNYLADYDYASGTSGVAVGVGADVNGDGAIDLRDLIMLNNYFAAYDYDTGMSGVVLGPVA